MRVGVHRGLVYLDTAQDDVFGLAANMAARVSGLAPPGTVVVSDSVEPLVKDAFELESLPPAPVKGIKGLISHSRVICERADSSRGPTGPLVGREREMARLRKGWVRAQAGTLATPGVVIRGEAGIGKSRLVAAAVELVEQRRWRRPGPGGVAVSRRCRTATGARASGTPLRHNPAHRSRSATRSAASRAGTARIGP